VHPIKLTNGPAKFCAIAAHLIRNEQINLRSGDGFRDCRSAEEVLAKIRDELGPEAASVLRRFNRASNDDQRSLVSAMAATSSTSVRIASLS
jgi:hypothetical protein